MIDESTIYWLTRLDHIRSFMMLMTILFSILTAVAVVVLVAVAGDSYPLGKEEVKSCLRIFGISAGVAASVVILFGCARVFVPTTKEMCAIKVIPAVANCGQVQSLGSDVVDLARSWMNELKPETVKSREAKK